jgi:hypothetical protein
MRFASIVSVAAMLVLAAGCTARNALPPLGGTPQTGDTAPDFATLRSVYVGMSGQVVVWGPTGKARIATLPQGSYNAAALALDGSKTLYVGNQVPASSSSYTCNQGGAVNFYTPGKLRAKRRVTKSIDCPIAVAVWKTSLYVLNANNKVTVYDKQSGALQRTISQGIQTPNAMVFDHQGNMYVSNVTGPGSSSSGTGVIAMFPPNANAPTKHIAFQHSTPNALAVDSKNDLFVGSVSNQPTYCRSQSSSGGPIGLVTELAPNGSSTVLSKIIGVDPVTALALDPSNVLYVAGTIQNNPCAGSSSSASFTGNVYVFGPTGGQPRRTIAMNEPYMLALDSSRNLYVADCTDNVCSGFVIREIRAGGAKLLRNLRPSAQPTALLAQ